LYSSADFAENTGTTLISFDSNGFKLADGDDIVYYGESGVAWCWKAGGNSNTFNINDIGYSTASAAGLTAGTITPTGASVNTKSGFSIIGYNGSGSAGSIPHGLGNTPGLILIKRRTTTAESWRTWHTQLGTSPTTELLLNDTTGARANQGGSINGVNSSTISFDGGGTAVNGSSNTYISYIWAEIPGFSKFGSYTGNGSTNFVNVGFRPRWIMIKRAVTNSSPDSTNNYSSWTIYDTARNTYNGQTPNHLYANKNINEGYRGNASDTSSLTDMTVNALSNGFYISGAGTEINANTGTYIYAAFAESPSFNLYGGQSNAR